jgi:hypothetical protein
VRLVVPGKIKMVKFKLVDLNEVLADESDKRRLYGCKGACGKYGKGFG